MDDEPDGLPQYSEVDPNPQNRIFSSTERIFSSTERIFSSTGRIKRNGGSTTDTLRSLDAPIDLRNRYNPTRLTTSEKTRILKDEQSNKKPQWLRTTRTSLDITGGKQNLWTVEAPKVRRSKLSRTEVATIKILPQQIQSPLNQNPLNQEDLFNETNFGDECEAYLDTFTLPTITIKNMEVVQNHRTSLNEDNNKSSSIWAGTPALSARLTKRNPQSIGFAVFCEAIRKQYELSHLDMMNVWKLQSDEVRKSCREVAESINTLLYSISTDSNKIENLKKSERQLQTEMIESQKKLGSSIDFSLKDYSLPLDSCTPQLQTLQQVLGDRYEIYLLELSLIIKQLRLQLLKMNKNIDDLKTLLCTLHPTVISNQDLFNSIESLMETNLSEKQKKLLGLHFDVHGSGTILIEDFIQSITKCSPPRQSLIDKAFSKLSQGQLRINTEKILTTSVFVHSPFPDEWQHHIANLVEVLKDSKESGINYENWIKFYTSCSDCIESDDSFVRFMNYCWEIMPSFTKEHEPYKLKLLAESARMRKKQLLISVQKEIEYTKDHREKTIQTCQNVTFLPLNGLNNKNISKTVAFNEKGIDLHEIVEFQAATCLYLNDSPTGYLPENIGKMKHLEMISTRNCLLKDFPLTIGHLFKLKYLYASGNHLTTQGIPSTFGNLLQVVELDLSYNNLTSVPKSFAMLSKMEMLALDHNRLQMIPECIFQELKKLTLLRLNDNSLKVIPDDIGNANNIRILHLQNNAIGNLPESLKNLTKLKEMLVHNNKLNMGEKESTWIDMSTLVEMEVFTLHNNEIRQLPSSLGNLSHLVKLQAWNNALLNLQGVHWRSLNSCISIDLHSNNLEQLPEGLCRLPCLKILIVNDNRLQELPGEIYLLKELTTLHVQNNQLVELPPNLGRLANLTSLNLSNNLIENLPFSFAEFALAKQKDGTLFLQDLKLGGNPLTFPLNEIASSGNYQSSIEKTYHSAMKRVLDKLNDSTSHPAISQGDSLNSKLYKGKSRNALAYLEKVFQSHQDKQGRLSTNGFKETLKSLGCCLSPIEIQRVVEYIFDGLGTLESFDQDQNGLDIQEFLNSIQDLDKMKNFSNVAYSVVKFMHVKKQMSENKGNDEEFSTSFISNHNHNNNRLENKNLSTNSPATIPMRSKPK